MPTFATCGKQVVANAATGLGVGAILVQFFLWYAIALLGGLMIWAVLSSFSEVFVGIFDR